MMPLIKLLPDIFVPTFEMKVQGIPLDPVTAKSITEISVSRHLNPPSQFSFTLNDLKLGFIDAQTGIFTEGTRVEISLGFVRKTSMIHPTASGTELHLGSVFNDPTPPLMQINDLSNFVLNKLGLSEPS